MKEQEQKLKEKEQRLKDEDLKRKEEGLKTILIRKVKQEAEKILFGPSAMKLRESKKGIGSMMASNITGRLHSNFPGLEIVDDQGFWPIILQDNYSINTTDKFEVDAAEDIIPGTIVELIIDLEKC